MDLIICIQHALNTHQRMKAGSVDSGKKSTWMTYIKCDSIEACLSLPGINKITITLQSKKCTRRVTGKGRNE